MRTGRVRSLVAHRLGATSADARRGLDDSAGNELTRARRYNRRVAVLVATLDGNHPGVDHLANELRDALRVSDIVGRSRGHCVIAVLPETTADGARAFLRRLAAGMDADRAEAVFVGVASFPDDGVTWVGLQLAARGAQAPLSDSLDVVEIAEAEVDKSQVARNGHLAPSPVIATDIAVVAGESTEPTWL